MPRRAAGRPRARLEHAWHLYSVRLRDAPIDRDGFIDELMQEQGMACSVHFIPLHLHPFYQRA